MVGRLPTREGTRFYPWHRIGPPSLQEAISKHRAKSNPSEPPGVAQPLPFPKENTNKSKAQKPSPQVKF